jgi:hypothetical protein
MWRLSLRELLMLVAIVALAVVSLKYASVTWQGIVLSLTLLAFVAAAIAAFVDRGSRQAFALGMAVTMIIYAALVPTATLGSQLPTSHVLNMIRGGVLKRVYVDRQTGEALPNYDPNNVAILPGGNTSPFVRPRQVTMPPSAQFKIIGHSWWALLLGYVGGRFARFVYVRRTGETEK